MKNKSRIELQGMKFFAYHGVAKQERIVGNTFLIDLKLDVDIMKAASSDKLEDTISYADIYQLVKAEMEIPSNLLEHVAKRILDKIMQSYPAISRTRIKLSKINPPVTGEVILASVILKIRS